ncbi:hypothetical protein EES43_17635 [Streptomyces sp. ADI96-02]|uniref:hypothetical protein n=1 Tax=Streptomyces sp. ADI96-02 TaxID=1522760 RepID=UPI000F55380D|nr:hypothetical protein [Streptomyces sp. ADI96-02]RPK60309.1 hypothetical protein EES43_17635 [Streptomyces sp. ADI96-02]
MRLPALLAFPRVPRPARSTGTDLPPDETVVLDGPDPALRPAPAAADGVHPDGPPGAAPTRPRRWWIWRVLALLVFTTGSALAWSSPETGWPRTAFTTGFALYYAGSLTRALRQRRAARGTLSSTPPPATS